ncbi:bifunctional 2-C-methyl-D-erythritol 4-phosphate cytidylyltransferase/2-C-methyl-D-erythritol 2,4-cyclodiphosphate synthase [Alphaproteobacteria bacterium]|nr:bifunctional 2-C-methyl-D-erythritol 4-phosphate cytidylyltransferase/2-C-methyl-D-erythritol 2,4-cyclodiphosphate synthase [Alphaproteobacteria bacterium]
MKNVAIILAAGNSKRMKGKIPKQFLLINNKPIINYSLEKFLDHSFIDQTYIVINKNYEKLLKNSLKYLNQEKKCKIIYGGKTRKISTFNALKKIKEFNDGTKNVLIHDAARPFVSVEMINKVIKELNVFKAVIPGVQSIDSLKSINDDKIIQKNINRESIVLAQTPQGFRLDEILDAHKNCKDDKIHDDAEIADLAGIKVKVIRGNIKNFKITFPEDLENFKKKYKSPSFRIGAGIDIHKFGAGKNFLLCGVKIIYKKKLIGHSDADVGIHAITDSILGAIGESDIGEHFPNTDNKWKNINSLIFLTHAIKLMNYKGGSIENLDLTIICEEPKVSKYKNKMKKKLSELMNISENQMNIKATTTEKLGFLGRNEGIAVQANILIRY